MIGAIAGDIIGSMYELHSIKTTKFPLFKFGSIYTDDSITTIAIANAILSQTDYASNLKYFGRMFSNAGYGHNFYKWLFSESNDPYNSWGNGAAMRVSPIGFAFNDLNTVLQEAKKSALVTHNHLEGIKGAQVTAASVFMAKTNKSKQEIKDFIESEYKYDLSESVRSLQATYKFDNSCQGTVPQAIICFLESKDFEDAIRLAISIGGDSDTIACICGGIAQAYYKEVPKLIKEEVFNRLSRNRSGKKISILINVVNQFCEKFSIPL